MDDTLKQQPKKSLIDEITAIELLREVLLGERKEKLLKNCVQTKKAQQNIVSPTKATTKPAYYEDKNTTINHRPRISQRVRAKTRKPNNNCIAFLAEHEIADIPDLTIKSIRARGLGSANMHLQIDEWAYDKYFAN